MRAREYLFVALTGLVAGSAEAAPKPIAELVTVDGEVNVIRAADGTHDAARQLGSKVRNGSLYSGDEVATGSGAAARLQFPDGSALDLRQATRLTLVEDDPPGPTSPDAATKPIGRRVFVLGGQVMVRTIANPRVATEFETPLGLSDIPKASVFTISVQSLE